MSRMWILPLCIFAFSFQQCTPSTPHNVDILSEYGDLQQLIEKKKGNTLIVNFWATTCSPCLKEMVHFNELYLSGNSNIDIVLVSVDKASDLETRVYPFIERHNILPEVVILDDQNYSSWTARVDSSWFGALPATLIIGNNVRKFRFGSYQSFEELLSDISQVENTNIPVSQK